VGLGWKPWTRERLTADELQGYIQDQVVMDFPDPTVRDAELAGSATEGMVTHADGRLELRTAAGGWRYIVGPNDAAVSTITVTGVLTGWSVVSANVQHLGNGMAYLDITWQRTGTAITVDAVGNIANLDMGTIPSTWLPMSNAPLAGGANGRAVTAYLQIGTGNVRITAVAGGANIVTGEQLQTIGLFRMLNP
jgi:hypothetical protein